MTNVMMKKAWSFIENVGSKKNNVIIAGGAVADVYFGKEFTDIDVFVAREDAERVEKFCAYYGFQPVSVPEQFRYERDSYGELRRIRVGKQESPILAVYKGKFLDYDMDFVIVNDDDVVQHVETRFDQNIKACYYNGQFHYTPAFMEAVTTGIVSPMRNEVSGYIRAWLSANKYNLELSPKYELSKHYSAYMNSIDELEQIASETTINKMERFTDQMFNFEVDMGNVAMMKVFIDHYRENEKLYEKICGIAHTKHVVRHPLAETEWNVMLKTNQHHQFLQFISQAINNIMSNAVREFTQPEVALITDLQCLQLVTELEFVEGKVMDGNNRSTRIGKYIQKVMRKHEDTLRAYAQAVNNLKEAMRLVENRSVTSKAKVFITGSKYALTHISTGTEWTSCQRWSLDERHGNNYGLMANLAGSTLVAYVADQRSDEDSSKWKARILIRIGRDGDLVLERTYTGRIEYNNETLRLALQQTLRDAGYLVHVTPEEAMYFKSLPMWTRPYQDVSNVIVMANVKGSYILRGRRKEVEMERRTKALKDSILEQVREQGLHFINIDRYTQVAVVALTEEQRREEEELRHHYHMHFPGHVLGLERDARYPQINAYLEEEDFGETMYLVVSRYLPYHLRSEARINRPVADYVPRAIAVPAMNGADIDGDGEFFDDLPF